MSETPLHHLHLNKFYCDVYDCQERLNIKLSVKSFGEIWECPKHGEQTTGVIKLTP